MASCKLQAVRAERRSGEVWVMVVSPTIGENDCCMYRTCTRSTWYCCFFLWVGLLHCLLVRSRCWTRFRHRSYTAHPVLWCRCRWRTVNTRLTPQPAGLSLVLVLVCLEQATNHQWWCSLSQPTRSLFESAQIRSDQRSAQVGSTAVGRKKILETKMATWTALHRVQVHPYYFHFIRTS